MNLEETAGAQGAKRPSTSEWRQPYVTAGGTLWSWPGQNPVRWRDPSGRFGVDDVNEALFWLDDLGALQASGDFSAGVSSALTFGLSDRLIDATSILGYGAVK